MNSRTNPFVLVLAAIAAGVVMWAVEIWLTSSGAAAFVPSVMLGVTLLALAVAALALGWPVRAYTAALRRVAAARADGEDAVKLARDAASKRVPADRATFALAFAKAVSLAGSIFAGCCAGIALFLGTRTVMSGRLSESIISLISAVILVVAGLVVESWCVLPPAGSDGLDGSDGAEAVGDAQTTPA